MSIRLSKITCPVPLSRPATRAAPREEQEDPQEAEIRRTQEQEAQMRTDAAECQKKMDWLKSFIIEDQKAEQGLVYQLLSNV